jgi:hypothetical protein
LIYGQIPTNTGHLFYSLSEENGNNSDFLENVQSKASDTLQ